jgi:riboflavin kinase/FMN adenylyltransferase
MTVGGETHVAAVNVGTNPTFGREPTRAEAYLLDFEGDLLGREVTLEFWVRLRDEVRFDSVENLVAAISEDVARTRDVVS